MLFGSAARGEQGAESDVDILVVRPAFAQKQSMTFGGLPARLSVLVRSPRWLQDMSAGGHLFALHLQREGRALHDPSGILAAFCRLPVSVPFAERICDVRRSSSVLHARDLDASSLATLSVARHLLRTALFLRCARQGTPTFSHREASQLLRAPELADALSRSASSEMFPRMRQHLQELVGVPDHVAWPLRDLVVVPTCRRFALQLLRDDAIVDYDPERVALTPSLAA